MDRRIGSPQCWLTFRARRHGIWFLAAAAITFGGGLRGQSVASDPAMSGMGAMTPAPQHPLLPEQPRPAGTTPASGSTAPAGHAAPMDAIHHDDMAMPTNHGGMAMPMGHEMAMSFGPIADSQGASGTAWQPEATPMHAQHSVRGDWMVMTHYNAFLAYDDQSGPRGGRQFNVINWAMLMATRRAAENEFTLRGMFSLEPWTTTAKGYPLLFQSGEAYHRQPLVDRQHPHDFFMELAVRYRRLINPDTVASLYVAPSGEPALGPPAFMHRASASDNPAAPISHHWLDSTHISFGVVTAGVARKAWQIEGSAFNGREPDEDRWDVEHPHLDSYSGRLTWNPAPAWSAQISHGYLHSPEELSPREHVWRSTASIMNESKRGPDAHLASTLAWGLNEAGGVKSHAVALESNWTNGRETFFGRAEYVEKTGEELDLRPSPPGRGSSFGREKFAVRQFTLGASRELVQQRPWQLALGGEVSYSFKPGSLDALYGRHPIGFWIFLRLRPAAMEH
jgi:hypothetical protein